MLGILNKVNLPNVNTIKERMRMRTIDNLDSFKNKYKDLKIISLVNNNNSNIANINNLDGLLDNVFGCFVKEEKKNNMGVAASFSKE
jgi:hypothetical protein